MKKKILLLSVIALTIISGNLSAKHNHSDLKINTKVSNVEWIGKKVTGQHSGSVSIKEGTLNLHDGHLSTGKIVINMTSITCTDLKPGEGAEGRRFRGTFENPNGGYFHAACGAIESHMMARVKWLVTRVRMPPLRAWKI